MTKRITTKTRKIINKSGKSKCPICETRQILVGHHINGREIPDAESLFNKAYICDNCHKKIHMGQIIIEGWFQTTLGKELFWHKLEEVNFTGTETKPYIIPGQ